MPYSLCIGSGTTHHKSLEKLQLFLDHTAEGAAGGIKEEDIRVQIQLKKVMVKVSAVVAFQLGLLISTLSASSTLQQ